MNYYAKGARSLSQSRKSSSYELATGKGAFGLSDNAIRQLNSPIPVAVLEPNIVRANAETFEAVFPGRTMYAIKCNPDKVFLKALYAGGVNCFDAASLEEIKLIRELLPFASIYFMHPIKAPEAIYAAYHTYRVHSFVLDHESELTKILRVLPDARDIDLFVRIAVPTGNVATDFSKKFGAKFDEAVELLRDCRQHCVRLGVSFHVGTQCTDTDTYYKAVRYAASVIKASGVSVESLDIGGGFPTALDDNNPPPAITEYIKKVTAALKEEDMEGIDLLCEAGRGLVADGGSLVVRVEGRKGNMLYLNDGTYGGLFEAGGSIGLPYPTRLIRNEERRPSKKMEAFRFAGPTCDSVDIMNGPFMLPEDVRAGDWIAINKLGAYGEVSRTNFNGFGKVKKVVVRDPRLSVE